MRNKKKIKILFIGPVPPELGGKVLGGVATYCSELAKEANKKSYKVYILAATSQKSFNKNGVKILAFPKVSITKLLLGLKFFIINNHNVNLDFLSLKQKLWMYYQAIILKEILEKVKPDLIHVLQILDNVNLSLGILKKHPPIVVSDHGSGLLYESNMHRIYGSKTKKDFYNKVNLIAKKVNLIISGSNFSGKKIQLFKIKKNKVTSITYPTDTKDLPLINKVKIKKELRISGKKVILFVGVHEPIRRKRLDLLLETIAQNDYLRKNCKLIVITKGDGFSLAKEFIKNRKLDGLVLKNLSRRDLIRYYNGADIFVMPSKQEGMGLVYYESLLAGTPVIGFHESIKEIENILGIYIGEKFNSNIESTSQLAKKIIKVLNRNFDRKLLRKKVTEKLSWKVKFKEFDSVYKEILRGGK